MADISIEDLTFTYPGSSAPALDSIDLEIEDGSFVLICGRNGSGKTTLLKHLKTLLAPKGERSGTVYYDDVPLDEISLYDQANKIAYVSQIPSIQLVADKVWHEIAFGLESIGCDNSTIRSRIAEIACYYNIEPWFEHRTSELSGGQQQLVALASVSVLAPDVVILDNPISQLESLTASDFLTTVRRFNLQLGKTIIVCEQKLDEVYHLADKVVVMDNGRIVHQGAPLEVAKSVYEANDQMKYALPTQIRLYHGLSEGGDMANAPLTIGESRRRLSAWARSKGVSVSRLPDKHASSLVGLPALEFENVWFRYERQDQDVLRGFDLTISRGSIHALVGDCGSGKSTALKIACGAIKQYQGSVRLYKQKISRMHNNDLYQTGIGMLPQNIEDVFSKQTVREELEEMIAFKRLPKDELAIEVNSTAHTMGILDLLDEDPLLLSCGQQQLVAIAKLMMRDLRVLLFDEPTKSVDALSKRQFARALHELTERGVTVVLASSDFEFCAKYATAVSMLFEGSVITTATPQAFFSANSFYTTSASRLSRDIFENTVTDEEVFILCQENGF